MLLLTNALGGACTRPLPAGWHQTATPATTPIAATIRSDIEAAARAYAESHSTLRDFGVALEALSGDYARVGVFPPLGVTDPAWAFLLRTGGQWAGLTMGTTFAPQTYELLGIPPAVRLPGPLAATPAATPSPSGRGYALPTSRASRAVAWARW